jgi:hypothetical protein
MKELNIVKPEEYFLEISPLKKHPNFSEIKNTAYDSSSVDLVKIKRGNAYQHTKTGFREDLGLTLRSNWEANFARILTAYKIKFDFEPTVFAFPIKRRNKRLYSRFFYTS